MDDLLKKWNEAYFDGQLSPEVLHILDGLALSTQSETVQGIIERQFKAMRLTHFQATDFTDDQARAMYVIPDSDPDAWAETPPPPRTISGRHVKIDAYISCNRWWQFPPTGKFLDLGCGFPPVTTIETAKKLTDWQIVGADPIIPYYIVYDEQDDYATFNQAGELLYFQGQEGRTIAFLRDPARTKRYFNQLFQALFDLLFRGFVVFLPARTRNGEESGYPKCL